MESLNVVAGNKAPSGVSSKNGEEMDHSLVAGEAKSNVSSKNSEEKVGLYAVPGGSPKEVDLDESNLEVKSLKSKDETPVIVLDPVNESSEGENLDESNLQVNSPPLVHNPSQDSAKGKDDVEVPPVEPEASDAANAEQEDEEYACKYCHRKFSNKQSLGGHQNAHKFERAMEKDASEAQESRAGYFGGTSSLSRITSPLSSHPGSLKRSYEYMNRPLQIGGPYQSQQMLQHQGMHVAHTVLPSMQSQVVPHHFHEFSRGYHPVGWTVPPLTPRISTTVPTGWTVPPLTRRISTAVPTVPVPRVSQFVTAQPSYLPSLGLTLQFPNQGALDSSSRPVSQGLSAFPESRSVPGRNAGVQNNNQMNVPGNEEDDSGLDLTLRL